MHTRSKGTPNIKDIIREIGPKKIIDRCRDKIVLDIIFNDAEFMSEVINYKPQYLRYAPIKLRGDREFILKISSNPEFRMYRSIDIKFLDDDEIMYSYICHHRNRILGEYCISHRLRNDPEFMLKCLKMNPYVQPHSDLFKSYAFVIEYNRLVAGAHKRIHCWGFPKRQVIIDVLKIVPKVFEWVFSDMHHSIAMVARIHPPPRRSLYHKKIYGMYDMPIPITIINDIVDVFSSSMNARISYML